MAAFGTIEESRVLVVRTIDPSMVPKAFINMQICQPASTEYY